MAIDQFASVLEISSLVFLFMATVFTIRLTRMTRGFGRTFELSSISLVVLIAFVLSVTLISVQTFAYFSSIMIFLASLLLLATFYRLHHTLSKVKPHRRSQR